MTMVNRVHRISQIPQPRRSAKCWAACLAMMQGRQGRNADEVVNGVVAESRRRGVRLFEDASLPESNVGQFAAAFALRRWRRADHFPFTSTVHSNVFLRALERGPIMVFGYTRSAQAHVIVVNGIRGEVTPPNDEGIDTSTLRVRMVGYDPVVEAGGGGFEKTVALFQNYMTIHNILHR